MGYPPRPPVEIPVVIVTSPVPSPESGPPSQFLITAWIRPVDYDKQGEWLPAREFFRHVIPRFHGLVTGLGAIRTATGP